MFKIEIQRFDHKERVDAVGKKIEWVDKSTKDVWTVSYFALVRAAMLVGRQSMFDVTAAGEFSKLELRWRSAMLRANTTTAEFGKKPKVRRVVPTSAFLALDGSEKSAVSYLLGMAAAKIASERECNVRWLMHLDVYSKPVTIYGSKGYKVLNFPGTKERPDLIGLSPNSEWAVFEAKGRTGTVTDDFRVHAKNQTRKIDTIDGIKPKWRLASIAQLMKRGLKLDIVDPPEPYENAYPLRIGKELFLQLAYRPTMDILNAGDRRTLIIRDRKFVVVDLPEGDLSLGLQADIFDALNRPPDTFPAGVIGFVRDKVLEIMGAVEGIPKEGLDGPGGQANGFQAYSIGADGTLMGFGKSWKPDGDVDPTPPLAPFARMVDAKLANKIETARTAPPSRKLILDNFPDRTVLDISVVDEMPRLARAKRLLDLD